MAEKPLLAVSANPAFSQRKSRHECRHGSDESPRPRQMLTGCIVRMVAQTLSPMPPLFDLLQQVMVAKHRAGIHPAHFAKLSGARTHACRVETHLDAWLKCRFVSAHLYEPSSIQNKNHVGHANRGEPVRHQNRDPAVAAPPDKPLLPVTARIAGTIRNRAATERSGPYRHTSHRKPTSLPIRRRLKGT